MTHSSTKSGRSGYFSLLTLLPLLMVCSFLLPKDAIAQGAYYLPTQLTANTSTSSNSFISFEITAHQSVRLYRFWNSFAGTGSTLVDIWARPNGYVNQNTGWNHVGRATVNVTNAGAHVEIPINLDLLIQPNETWGFIISHHSISVRYNSVGTFPTSYTDGRITIQCGSHCAGTGTGDPLTNTTSFSFSLCPRQWAGAVYYDEGSTAYNDAGITSLDSPKDFCPGAHDVQVTLQNFGKNQITSATINWTLNGVPQPAVNWTGLLDTINTPSRKTSVTLASNMNFSAGIPYNFQIWSTNPNGVPDTANFNDTLTVTRKSAIAGTFTIGGASPDYPNIAAAVTDLNDNGVCGPVIFNIRNGNYNANISLGPIAGASSVNTITFQSESGNKADVNITHGATALTNNFVVQFNSSSYVTVRNLTLTATGASFGTVVEFRSGATDNLVENCELVSPVTTLVSTNMAVVFSPSGSLDHRNTVRDCGIRNGSYGAYIWGASTASYLEDFTFENCEFTDFRYMGFYGYYLERLKLHDNLISTNSVYTILYGTLMYYQRQLSVERNTVFLPNTGTRYGLMFGYSQPGVMNRVVNNFVTINNTATNTVYGFYPLYNNDMLMAHNTVYINGTSPTASRAVYQIGGSNNRFINNIFYNAGTGYAMYIGTPTAITEMDYNAYYTTGVNLGYWSANRANLAAWQTASGRDANAVVKPVSFRDFFSGDLHLVAPSDDDNDLVGVLLPAVTDDIDHDPRVRPYRGADEACYLIPNSLTYEFVDESGNPIGYIELPGTVGVRYKVIFPEFDATITMTANFYSVPGNQLMYSQSFQANKLYGQPLDGISYFNVPANLPTGYYRIELVFNTKNSCGYYRDYMPYPSSLLLVPRGATPCEVWPGDVNNDGAVNYGDRKDLNTYIHDANLRPTWLTGPARYRADAAENPLTYIQWSPQASAPWFTPEGCYMDADGNGIVNNFDYIAIKLNWMRTHGGVTPRSGDSFMPTTFDMSQNFPNPFNPTTTIQYSVPEPSRVHLRIVDMLGRVVATAVDGMVDAGVYLYTFDASALPSGQYLAIVNMVGEGSGLSFSKTIKMALNK
jgi:hypothetical protein